MKEITIAGFGGQGVLSLGLFLSYSAINMGYNTSWLPSYGPEMRGGTANVGVVYSSGEIACPLVSNPDVLVAFNEPSLDKFENSVKGGFSDLSPMDRLEKIQSGEKEEGYIFVNSSAVGRKVRRTDLTGVYYVPVDELASGINPRGGNIIMLGAMLPILKSLSLQAAQDAIRQVFKSKPDFIEPNLKCLQIGMSYIEGEGKK